MALIIYHNPRCSKSRQTLALIEEAGIAPIIIRYLDEPLSVEALETLKDKLGFESAREMMRTKEAIYKELSLKDQTDEKALFEAMASHPKLIERPIVEDGTRAIMGRPPENVRALYVKD